MNQPVEVGREEEDKRYPGQKLSVVITKAYKQDDIVVFSCRGAGMNPKFSLTYF